MGKAKVLIKQTVTKTTAAGRKNHRAHIFAGNGKLIMATPSHQHYYNEPELIDALKIARDALNEFLKDK